MGPKWRALGREAALASEHIALGVSALGRANHSQYAYYSEAFFALSVGLERSCKLGLVVDYALRNGGTFPRTPDVRAFGHDLERLLKRMDRRSRFLVERNRWPPLPPPPAKLAGRSPLPSG
jgi:hypothetical protein